MKKMRPLHRNTLIATLAAIVVFAGVSYASILQSDRLAAVTEPMSLENDVTTMNYVAGGTQSVDVSLNDYYPNPSGTFITSVAPNGFTTGFAFANPPYNIIYTLPGGYAGSSYTDVFTVNILDSVAGITATSQLIVNVNVTTPLTPDTLVINGTNQVGVGLRVPISGSLEFNGVPLPPPGNVSTTISHPANVTVYTNITGGSPITDFTFTPTTFENVMFYVQGETVTTSPINIVFTPSPSSGIAPASHEMNVIPGPPAQITVNASPNTVQAGGSSIINVNLVDTNGNPTVLTTPMILNINLSPPMNAYEVGGTSPITNLTFPVNTPLVVFEVQSTLIGSYPINVNLGSLAGSVEVNVISGDPYKLLFIPDMGTTPPNVLLPGNIFLLDMYNNYTTSPTPFNVNLSTIPSVGASFVPDVVVFPANVSEIIVQFLGQLQGEYTELADAIGLVGAVGQITVTGGGTGSACNIPNVNIAGCTGTTTVKNVSEFSTWTANPATNLVMKGGPYNFGNSDFNINTQCNVNIQPIQITANAINILANNTTFDAKVSETTPVTLRSASMTTVGPSSNVKSNQFTIEGTNVSHAGKVNAGFMNVCATSNALFNSSSQISINPGGNLTVNAADANFSGRISGSSFTTNTPTFTLEPSNRFEVPQNCIFNGTPTPASFMLKGTCTPGPIPF